MTKHNWIPSRFRWRAAGVPFCVVVHTCEYAKHAHTYLVHAVDAEGWLIAADKPISKHRSANAAIRAAEALAA